MMRRTLLALLLLAGMTNFATAGNGYRVEVRFTDRNLADSQVYLAHYYGKPLPTIYKIDSARFDKNNTAVLQSKDTIVGGIFIVLLGDKKTYFEFLLNNGADISITAKANELPRGVSFKKSPENERFVSYMNYLGEYSIKQQEHQRELAQAKTRTDSSLIYEKSAAEGKAVAAYRKDYVAQYPGTLLANIFNALEVPKVPDDRRGDTAFAYNYYRAHYWDKFDFNDDRLVYTPIYDSKLEDYFNNVIPQIPDTFSAEADKLLAKVRGSKELFKYTLHTLAQNAQNSKIMGMDESFIHLVENYYMKGDAYWLSADMLEKYIDRARKIAPNVIGNMAPELKMVDLQNKEHSLNALKAKYTLLIFWSPTCGTCLQEVPKLDSLYRAVLKDKGVRVYAVRTDSDIKIWKEKIDQFKINDWVNVYDPNHKTNYKSLYDVYGTPSVYLLDEKKIIRGKRVGHENILQLIEILESGHTLNTQKKS